MPPRKSDHAPAAPSATPTPSAAAADENSPTAKGSQSLEKKDKDKDKDKEKEKERERERDAVTIEDLNLPKSIITRLAKGILPPNTQIQGNAILALSKSATVFISYLAAHANENTLAANKKTVSPADVFKALDDIEFSFLREPLEAEFAKFNAVQTEKRTSYRQKVRAAKHGSGDDTEMADTTTASEAPSSTTPTAPRAAKKQRVDPTATAGETGAETEDDEPDAEVHDDEDDEDDDDDDEEEDAQEDEDEEEDQQPASGDETQDALEERGSRDDADEALDGDESD